MTKTKIALLIIIILITGLLLSESKSASINIGLTIDTVKEVSKNDDEDSPQPSNEEEEGVGFGFMPADYSEPEEKDYQLRVITNTEFEIEYFWEHYNDLDPRVNAYLNLKKEKYAKEFKNSNEFKNYIRNDLTVGKNPLRKPRVKLVSTDLKLDYDDELKFQVNYDPSIMKADYPGQQTENTLRVILTFTPPLSDY